MSLLEDGFRVKLLRLKISVEQLSQFTSIRSQTLFAGLKGSKPLTGPEIQTIDRVLRDLQSLVNTARPFPISMNNTPKIKFLLDRMHDGDLEKALTPYAKTIADEMDAVCT